MKIIFGDKYKIVKEENSHSKKDGLLLLLLFLIQMLLSYLGNIFNSVFYFLEVIPILVLFFMLHQKIKKNMLDLLIIIFIALFLSLFANDVFSLI